MASLSRSGDFNLRWKKPLAYQQSDGKRKEVPSAYVLTGNQVSFKLGNYDRSRELVIDPALVYSTYIGGSPIPTRSTARRPRAVCTIQLPSLQKIRAGP